uniref:Uncharacterized protein n=1 Tax=Anguilla anguilla TaxID=7936 RepID=A0A0E9U1X2_ANGAN
MQVSNTWTCCLDGSCTMAVPFTFLSSTPQVPAARMYWAPFPGYSSRLLTSVPTGRAPRAYESPSLAELPYGR